MKQYYIYKIICLKDEWNGKFYIGKHYGELNDNYTGSGKMIKEYFKKFPKEKDITYEKIILEICDEMTICDIERFYIVEGMKSELCLNLYVNSSKSTYRRKFSQKQRNQLSQIAKQRLGDKNPFYGKHHSEESIRKMSEKKSGKNHPNYGKNHSEETIRRMSEARKKYWEQKKSLSSF